MNRVKRNVDLEVPAELIKKVKRKRYGKLHQS
jgi:hypothetical protein